MKLLQHIKKVSKNRTASAPYNFVPLPEKVVIAVDAANSLPDHNSFASNNHPHSGYFDITLTTKSPLYVRCPLTLEEFSREDHKAKNKPDFFYINDSKEPVIPGSSLRGMLRSLLEIAAYGKMQGVSNRRLFFRSVGNEAVGCYYRELINESEVTRGYGFAKKNNDDKWIIEECDVARVRLKMLEARFGRSFENIYTKTGPDGVPRHDLQYMKVWVKLDTPLSDSTDNSQESPSQYRVNSIRNQSKNPKAHDEYDGTLVLTGPMNSKKKAFVFLKKANARQVEIPNDTESVEDNARLLDRFNGDQMTKWQKNAFPATVGKTDIRDGQLRDNDPVFYIISKKDDKLVFFGRAYLFRLPYHQSPLDFVPEPLRRPDDIDYAEALFGFTSKDKTSYAGRITVTDAKLCKGQSDIWLFNEPITPRILASPKPSTIQHYLVQTTEQKDHLVHYGSERLEDIAASGTADTKSATVIRGFKRYWHQGLGDGLNIEEIRRAIEENNQRLKDKNRATDDKEDTQHTKMKPVRHGVKFNFRVHFENLSDRELGALCWILQPTGEPGKSYCHHLGMGKPLGLGGVKLEAKLFRIDRRKRYLNLLDSGGWTTGGNESGESLENRELLEQLTLPFENHIISELKPARQCRRLHDLRRVGMLLKTMEWPGFRADLEGDCYPGSHPNTRYMSIKNEFQGNRNEFKERPVLPDPSAFGKLSGEVESSVHLDFARGGNGIHGAGANPGKPQPEKDAAEA